MFDYTLPTRIVFGSGVINKIGEIVKEYGDRILLVTDSGTMYETGYLTRVKKMLEDETHGVLLYDRVVSDSNSDLVNAGADQAKHARCDVVVGFGRKHTLNIAKAITYILEYGGKMEDYFLGRKSDKKENIYYVEVPSGHGFSPGLTKNFYVIDKFDNTKKTIENIEYFADLVICDPKLATTVPGNLSHSMSIEALAYAIEAFISKSTTPIADAYAIKAIEMIGSNLVRSMTDPENVTYRSNLSVAGLLTSMALASSTPGTTFALSLALNSVLGTYQSAAATVLIPHIMEFNLTSAPNRYVQIAKAFGENVENITVVEAAIKAIESVRKLLFDVKAPQRLSDLEVDRDKLWDIAKVARGYDFLHYLPRPLSKDDIYNLLNTAI
jgi:alcohol dehydrogenase class IV